MLDQFHRCIQDSIENIIDVKADGNCGYRAIAALLVCNHFPKELTSWWQKYINLLGGIKRFKELKRSLLVDGLSMIWDISLLYDRTSQPPPDSSVHRVICIGHVYENHFVQVLLRDHCLLPPLALLWNTHYHYQAKQWPTRYIGRMQHYTNLSRLKIKFV
ncbi:hypothetical protein GmHk_09G025214 [Glycine max]|nr:hypothetical protein GmHk_09G025214 [Glycine max]